MSSALEPHLRFPSYVLNAPATEVTTLSNGVRVATEVSRLRSGRRLAQASMMNQRDSQKTRKSDLQGFDLKYS